MSWRKRLVFLFGLLVLSGILIALCAPFVVAHGLRFWLERTAHNEGLSVDIDQIQAPFLGNVTIEGLRIYSSGKSAAKLRMEAPHVLLDFNFRGRLFSRHRRLLRNVDIEQLNFSLQELPGAAAEKFDWVPLRRLLSDQFRLAHLDLDVATTATEVQFRDAFLSASEIESGRFFARETLVSTPILRRRFTNLAGATSWEESRLTMAGIALVPGLDLESITIDLGRLDKQRLGLDLNLDVFGGTLRAGFQGHAGDKFDVDFAASATNISLAQLSTALGSFEPITGSIRASKFTFRGNPGAFLESTASLWLELEGFAWRDRRADQVMLGASFYDRRLELDQLYVKQRLNELTIKGELPWPKQPVRWTNLPFRAQFDASIPDLNGLAQLLGAQTGALAGALFVKGQLDSLGPTSRGEFTIGGKGVSIAGVALDSLGADVQLHGSEAAISNLEIRHANDFVRAYGNVGLAKPHAFSGRMTGAINDLAIYKPLVPARWQKEELGGGITFDWNGDGTFTAHSGAMQFFGHGLKLPMTRLNAPFDLTLEGTYSPQDIFFRTFQVGNSHASLGGFLMLGTNFIELQALQLALDGIPHLSGTLFLPFSAARWWRTSSWIEALDPRQKFDVDLLFDRLDLNQLGSAVGHKFPTVATLDGKIAAYGVLDALQLTSGLHFYKFSGVDEHDRIDLDLRCAGNRLESEVRAQFGSSEPLSLRAYLPLRLTKEHIENSSLLDPSGWISLTTQFPALFLEKLPEFLRPIGLRTGLLSGEFALANTLSKPQVTGSTHLIEASIAPSVPFPGFDHLNASLTFHERGATIESLHVQSGELPLSFSGRVDVTTTSYTVELTPDDKVIGLTNSSSASNAFTEIHFLPVQLAADPIQRMLLRGDLNRKPFSLTMESAESGQRTFFVDSIDQTAQTLLFEVGPPSWPAGNLDLRVTAPEASIWQSN